MEREEYSGQVRGRGQQQYGGVGTKANPAVVPGGGHGPTPKQIKFEVAFCSGEDAEFPAGELNTHSPQTRGWQSPPFCAYPQEIGLEFLVGQVQLSQLQILSHESKIATKIDVFVGNGESYETCAFKRLGHLSLDENERSDFAARELKSVYIGKQGRFLKLLIHKCHLNRHNIYNQAGIIAINVLGVPSDARPASAHSLGGAKYVAPPQKAVPPLEDLAFDMNFDKQTAQVMRELHQAKEAAVADEDFELAKELKRAQDQLKHFGVKIAGLENAKLAAVQREDYDKAALVKKEISALRDEVEHITGSLLRGGRAPRSGRQLQGAAPVAAARGWSDSIGSARLGPETSPRDQQVHIGARGPYGAQPHLARSSSNNNYDEEDDAGLDGGAHERSFDRASHDLGAFGSPSPQMSHRSRGLPGDDERPLPVLQRSPGGSGLSARGNPAHDFPGDAAGATLDGDAAADQAPTTDPEVIAEALGSVPEFETLPEAEPLPVGLANETQPLVDVFGEYLVRCVFSRQVKLRSAALSALENTVNSYSLNELRVFSAFTSVCKIAATDKIANVFLQGLKVLELVTSKASELKRSDTHSVEALLPALVERLGNNTARLRAAASKALLHLASTRNVGAHVVAQAALRPTRQGKTLLWRQLLGRLKLVADLVQVHGLRDELGLGLEPVMHFVTANNALAHPHTEVRETTKDLVMAMYGHVGDEVMPFLKELRPKQLEEYQVGFDQLTGGTAQPKPMRREPSPGPSPRREAPGSARSGRSSARGSARRPQSSRNVGDEDLFEREAETKGGRRQGSGGDRELNININVSRDSTGGLDAASDGEEDEDETEPFTCQFCHRKDPSFTEDALDMHYWKECPMLTSCAQCEQVIEVSMLNDHLLNECENKDNHRQCPRCHEAIASQFFDQHVERASCLEAKPLSKANRCPLCHKDCKPGTEGWKHHILSGSGCARNPRTDHLR